MDEEQQPSEADFLRRDIEKLIYSGRYSSMSVYAAIGALEVVKQNMMDKLFFKSEKDIED